MREALGQLMFIGGVFVLLGIVMIVPVFAILIRRSRF